MCRGCYNGVVKPGTADDLDRPQAAASFAALIEDRTARGIAACINSRIRDGGLVPGDPLPTVRSLAAALGISPTTVHAAWRLLTRSGTIDARGRLGTFVRVDRRRTSTQRYRTVVAESGLRIDLATGVPDPDLLPDVRRALAQVSRRTLTTTYLDQPVLPPLEELLAESWPFTPDRFTVVDGALDALDRVLGAVVRVGDRVLVEDPGFPPLFDLIEQIGGVPVGVEVDDGGMIPSALTNALRVHPVAVVMQPRAQNPFGSSMTAPRMAELAAIVGAGDTLVVEDDHSGDVAWAPSISMGTYLPGRTVHIRSFSKSHGPDLRLAAVGGAGPVVDEIVDRRRLGPGWSSRLLQAVLVEMLRDPGTVATVAEAREEYHRRRVTLSSLLADRGVVTHGSDGINLWMDVEDEHTAQVMLNVAGVGVAPGAAFWLGVPATSGNLRVTLGYEGNQSDLLADALAAAARRS